MLLFMSVSGADPEPPIRGVLKLIFAREARAKNLATPFFTKPRPLNCREARQQPENVEKSVELEFLSLQTGLSVIFYS